MALNWTVLLRDAGLSLGRVFIWTSIAWILGVVLGYFGAKLKYFRLFMLPIVNFFRHISPFSWLPVVILLWGIGELSVGIILLLAMLFTAIIMALEMVKKIPKEYLEHAWLDGAHGFELFRQIELPLLRTDLVNLYRVLWSVAWTAVIAAEMLGVSSGMGYRLLDFRYLLMYPQMFVYIAVIGILGIAFDILLLRIERLISY